MQYVRIADRIVPMDVIENYVDHLVRSGSRLKKLGYNGYEYERARLHNEIFLSAGFKDTQWGTARKTAAWYGTMLTFRDAAMREEVGFDQQLVDFKDELDEVLDRLISKEKRRG